MKIGCSTVVFREYDLDRVLEVIKKIGYEYIETQATNPWCNHVVINRDDPVKFAEKVKSFGFKGVTALWTPDGAMIPCGDKCVDTISRSLEWAAAAGIPVVNCGDGHKPADMSEEDAFKALRERLLRLIEVAEKNKVALAIEPHGTFSLTLNGLKKVMAVSDSKYFGINYDCANIHRSGYVETKENVSKWVDITAEENEVTVLEGIINRIIHFHAKDLDKNRNCLALGTGEVLVRSCIDILKKHNYKGVVSLETEGGMPFEAIEKLAKKSYEFLKSYII
jgi:sugar phosphate isomerase/epimerase